LCAVRGFLGSIFRGALKKETDMPLTLREEKGVPLTHAEMDANFEYLEGMIRGEPDVFNVFKVGLTPVQPGDRIVLGECDTEFYAGFGYEETQYFEPSGTIAVISVSGRIVKIDGDGSGNVVNDGHGGISMNQIDVSTTLVVQRLVSDGDKSLLITDPNNLNGRYDGAHPFVGVFTDGGEFGLRVNHDAYTGGLVNFVDLEMRVIPVGQQHDDVTVAPR
jgi:hypothetical protein